MVAGVGSSLPNSIFHMSAVDLAIATLINTVFVAFNMYDVGADLWTLQDLPSRIHFLRSFLEFRANAPIVLHFLAFILLCVPFVVFKLFKEDVLGLIGGDCRFREIHLVGVLNLGCIVGVLVVTGLWIIPFQNEFIDPIGTTDSVRLEMFRTLFKIHVGQLLFNIFGILLPFFRWSAIDKAERKWNKVL